MAKLRLIMCTLLLLVALAVTAKQGPSYTYKAAAEICRPYFDACRAENTENKTHVSQCMTGFMQQCFRKVRKILGSMKECVVAAGTDLNSVSKCI